MNLPSPIRQATSKCYCFLMPFVVEGHHRTFMDSHIKAVQGAMSSHYEDRKTFVRQDGGALQRDDPVSKLDMSCKVECLYLNATALC